MPRMEVSELTEEQQRLKSEQTYDAALWSMLSRMKPYVVPLINELFGETFTDKAQVVTRNNKHVIHRTDGSLSRRENDGVLELSEMLDKLVQKLFVIECEAWHDNTIFLRIAEYDSSVTIENAVLTKEGIVMTHPNSAVVFLHSEEEIPRNMKIIHRGPNGAEMSYPVSAVEIKDYTLDQIFNKKLLILLPFYLFRFSDELEQMNADDEKRKAFHDAMIDVNRRLDKLYDAGEIKEYELKLTQGLLQRVSERLVLGYDNLMKEVEVVMGGVLLKTKADEILEQGIELGKEQGEANGVVKAASLFGFLLANGRNDDAIKASADPKYLHQLLGEFKGDIPSAT